MPGEKATARIADFRAELLQDAGYRSEANDAEAIRVALQDSRVRSLLRDLIGVRHGMVSDLICLQNVNDKVIASIRRRNPDVPLPIGVLELTGAATPAGWSGGVAMTRDARDPDRWSLTIELDDGPVKFRADGDFASNWGAPNLPEYRVSSISYEFGGDVSRAFPCGTAEFGGLHIPVQAGTYDVTFNTRSFAYSFERVR